MNNAEIAALFWEISELLELSGDNPFKARAYRHAAEKIESLPEPLSTMYEEGRLGDIEGIGEALKKKLEEIITTGRLRYYEDLNEKVPRVLVELLDIPGVGPKTARALYEHLHIGGIDELEAAAKAGRVRELPGMGVKTEQNILRGIQMLRGRLDRIPLGVAMPIAQDFIESIRRIPQVLEVRAAGSLRRRKETIGDIDIVAASGDAIAVMDAIEKLPRTREVLSRGGTRMVVMARDGIKVDTWVVGPSFFWSALHHSTGSKAHNVKLRGMAREMGLKINEYGISREDGTEILINREEDIYSALGLDFIAPELREDTGEIEAAREGRLPRLLEPGDIRGDLHMHSTWSDGVTSIEEMAEAARRMGYSYIAICDHSKSLGVARGLAEETLRRQVKAIRELNKRLTGMRVLAGVEVDIRRDGTLDHPDELLAELDIVVASVHSGFRQDADTMTARIIAAMRNPHVDIIGHPTGRLLGRREPYAVNIDALIEAAAETGTVLEINSYPDRLDLSDIHARMAKERGVKLAINTDAHSREQLGYIEYGVSVARRAWLSRDDVINAWEGERLLKFLGEHKH
ncbi:MAG TPA: DNA polymerase/3'-5' exonuclease PolX [Firmicutes bacterium]|nr:DNA polymerase/3'-5' exonuclease PolX [Bacillota bacterium]